jgi:hypothetical protein
MCLYPDTLLIVKIKEYCMLWFNIKEYTHDILKKRDF